jgi:cytochrome c oxidase assembly protein subunit 16
VTALSKEEELGMKKGRRKWDVREEYYVSSTLAAGTEKRADRADRCLIRIPQRLQATNDLGESTDWENKRVDRLPGQAEWGELPIAKGGAAGGK